MTATNEDRKYLFSRKSKDLESIPPTSTALFQHSKRAAYQAGHIWGTASKPDQKLPNPTDWGWIIDRNDKKSPCGPHSLRHQKFVMR